MNIGYACLTVSVPNTELKTCTFKNATNEKLAALISHNLHSLDTIMEYNHRNDIRLFRISSDIIPFGSSPANQLLWWEIFEKELLDIGQKIQRHGMRVSMHPGQYTVLNSPNEEVAMRAVQDLMYHARLLESLGVGREHKIILHVGGVYDDKEEAMERFVQNYAKLPEPVQNRLVIENDDRSYTIEDVLTLSQRLGIPAVFDNLHHQLNPAKMKKSETEWITACNKTWKPQDGSQKIHYSQQDEEKKNGAHSATIAIQTFLDFYHQLPDENIDIMLEVKDKNLSAVKCILCTKERRINELEQEWKKYKYTVLEKSQADYLAVRSMLKDKKSYPCVAFYQTIEHALKSELDVGNAENAALHVWGYVKNQATAAETKRFFQNMERFQKGAVSIKTVKNILLKLAQKYEQTYLLESHYFYL